MNGMVKGVCGLAVVASFKGVVYGGIGIGTATVKKVGTFPVVIE